MEAYFRVSSDNAHFLFYYENKNQASALVYNEAKI